MLPVCFSLRKSHVWGSVSPAWVKTKICVYYKPQYHNFLLIPSVVLTVCIWEELSKCWVFGAVAGARALSFPPDHRTTSLRKALWRCRLAHRELHVFHAAELCSELGHLCWSTGEGSLVCPAWRLTDMGLLEQDCKNCLCLA